MKINPAYVVFAVLSAFGSCFTAPIVAQYFWESILTGVIDIQAPAYWTMFALISGVRWMLLADVSFTIHSVSDVVGADKTAEQKIKSLEQAIYQPWLYMGIITIITYLCK